MTVESVGRVPAPVTRLRDGRRAPSSATAATVSAAAAGRGGALLSCSWSGGWHRAVPRRAAGDHPWAVRSRLS